MIAEQTLVRTPNDEALEALRRHSLLRDVGCEFAAGELRLIGVVSTYYAKQVAQSVVRGIPGIDQIRNELIVPQNELE